MAGPVRPCADGVLLLVEVVPGASEDAFPAGYNPWRERVQARVTAPPADGRANAALCRLVAEHFRVGAADVSVTAGHTSRQKTLLVRGVDETTARAKLAGVVP